jgi:hypothetical protein
MHTHHRRRVRARDLRETRAPRYRNEARASARNPAPASAIAVAIAPGGDDFWSSSEGAANRLALAGLPEISLQAIGAACRRSSRSTSAYRVGWTETATSALPSLAVGPARHPGRRVSRRPVALRLGIREGAADRAGESLEALAIAAIRDHLDKLNLRDPELVEPFDDAEKAEQPGV